MILGNRTVIELLDSTGAKVAQLDCGECSASTSRVLNGSWTIDIKYPVPPDGIGENKSAYLTAWQYRARVRDLNASTYQTFTLTKTTEKKSSNGSVEISASGEHRVIMEFNEKLITGHLTFVNQTPTQILTRILTYASGWSCGTVGPTNLVSLDLSWESVMSGINKLLAICGGEWNPDEVNSEVDISSALGTSNYVHVRQGINLESLQRTKYMRNAVNKMYGVGDGATSIAGARHVVSGYVSGTGVLTAVGNKIVPENDSWNTAYRVKFASGTEAGNSFVITDCVHGATSDTLTISTGRTIAAGDKFFIETTAGVAVNFIRAGVSITSIGTIEGANVNTSRSDAANLVATPALDGTYTAGLCQDWTKEGAPTVSENTTLDYLQFGAKSQKIIATADAQGISQSVAVTSGLYYLISAWVYISSGTVKLQVSDGVTTWTSKKTTTGWQRFNILERAGSATLTVKILQDGAPATTFYMDAVMVVASVSIINFTGNADNKSLWDETFDALMLVKDPSVEYECNFIDLYKISPLDYPFMEISLGDYVIVTDDELGIAALSLRVDKVNADVFRPEFTKYTVTNG